MIQTFQEKRKPKFSEQIMQGLNQATSEAATEIPRFFGERILNEQKKEKEAAGNKQFQDMFGINIEGYSPDERKIFIQEMLKNQNKQQQDLKKTAPLQSGLQTLQRMKQISGKGNIGFGSGFSSVFSPETRQDRAEYERLGKSLISLASNISIRNQREFDTLAEGLYDPSTTNATRKGILDAMERIIKTSLEEQGGEMNMMQGNQDETVPITYNGEVYDLPPHLVPAFKQRHGIR